MIACEQQNKRPLTPWELPCLLTPVHQYRQSKPQQPEERPHYPAILSFVYRNRYAIASQIQRRFTTILKSDRTARRHLAEMEALGYLDVIATRSVSPLWPKVYCVTKRGARRLRQALTERGKPGDVIRVDRSRREGYSAEHVIHEILTTEFLLAVWQTTQAREELALLQVERRSLGGNTALAVGVNGTATAVEPDAMFVYRKRERGMMCCFVELDNGTMSVRQLQTKFRRYEHWLTSLNGKHFLRRIYEGNGATKPTATCRLLIVANTEEEGRAHDRLADILAAAESFKTVQQSLWLTTVARLRDEQFGDAPLSDVSWHLANDAFNRIANGPKASNTNRRKLRTAIADVLASTEARYLFGVNCY